MIPDILERFEAVSMNGNEGMYLWEEMNGLGEYLLQQLKEATLLRVEASIMCCSQIDSFKFIFQVGVQNTLFLFLFAKKSVL